MANTLYKGKYNMAPPVCDVCGGSHEPEYPHYFSLMFRMTFFCINNRFATYEDAYRHCDGLMYAAAEAAYKEIVAAESKLNKMVAGL